ncbi:Gfo/Idh/MocA family protein [Paenibacillus spongiae]|uniref:Gfo/Idh/MocA family oxidoreductase n=1 Tax=Paenibacillus spongiae TaxID=2909671 RepID=A0ABY5SI23_9BACL|nr:Gfo/Idh/MocA family oxidoreductase [Paenibacillus spongiae]UVI33652.1 Gfo/Idh/MocA family oxidoreductase [Paenibacillus spongiae]
MIRAVLIGAGSRGTRAYAPYALKHPHELQFIAVAEPDKHRRLRFAKQHGIAGNGQYDSWEALLDSPRLADFALICTQDNDHYEPAMKALRQGYHVMLEKPMSPRPDETLKLAEEAERQGKALLVCHVLRYTPFFQTVKKLLSDNRIGSVVSIQWNENVGYWHQAHSYVRGNWRNTQQSSPMLLAKCCHDLDLIQWLTGDDCRWISSFGGLSYFNKEHAPEGSAERCTDGCAVEMECPYSAIKWYFNEKDEWPHNAVSPESKLEQRWKAIKEGPYGRCVFRCDNDVVDHQVVTMQFQKGVTAAFTMTAFTQESSRTFKIMGSEGEIRGHLEKNEIDLLLFSGQRERIVPPRLEGGHSGGDYGMVRDIIQLLRDREVLQESSHGRVSAQSHMLAFAAEHSRMTGQTVVFEDYVRTICEQLSN